MDAFYAFAQIEQKREAEELIKAENLNAEAAKRFPKNCGFCWEI